MPLLLTNRLKITVYSSDRLEISTDCLQEFDLTRLFYKTYFLSTNIFYLYIIGLLRIVILLKVWHLANLKYILIFYYNISEHIEISSVPAKLTSQTVGHEFSKTLLLYMNQQNVIVCIINFPEVFRSLYNKQFDFILDSFSIKIARHNWP